MWQTKRKQDKEADLMRKSELIKRLANGENVVDEITELSNPKPPTLVIVDIVTGSEFVMDEAGNYMLWHEQKTYETEAPLLPEGTTVNLVPDRDKVIGAVDETEVSQTEAVALPGVPILEEKKNSMPTHVPDHGPKIKPIKNKFGVINMRKGNQGLTWEEAAEQDMILSMFGK